MVLPAHIVDRITSILATMETEGGHVDHEAARYGGIALMGTIGATWLVRPDGTFWDVDDDFGRPLTPLADERHASALAYGVKRYPWLADLLPERPVGAVDCIECGAHGWLPYAQASAGEIQCPQWDGLGWLRNARPAG
jgi:hypothetical protein